MPIGSFFVSGATINRRRGVSGAFTVATGGTITTDGNFKVHTFTGSSTFTVTQFGIDPSVQYLIIAGGGGAGAGNGSDTPSGSGANATSNRGSGGGGGASYSGSGGSGGSGVVIIRYQYQ